MRFSIASWNVEGRLADWADPITRRGSWRQILTGIRNINADIIFLCEAYDESKPVPPKVNHTFTRLGYKFYDFSYEEKFKRDAKGSGHARPVYRLASRLPLMDISTVRLGGIRNIVTAKVLNPVNGSPVAHVLGIHLVDVSEERRLQQLPDLIQLINEVDLPIIMLGDYNSMHGNSRTARMMRNSFSLWVAHHFPLRGLRNFLTRSTGMATGTVLATLGVETNLRDADSRHQPTATPKVREYWFLPSVRLIDLDHILVSPKVIIHNFSVGNKDSGADHRPLMVIVEVPG